MKRFTMKRITAFVLALIMTLSLVPTTAWAEALQANTDEQVYVAADEPADNTAGAPDVPADDEETESSLELTSESPSPEVVEDCGDGLHTWDAGVYTDPSCFRDGFLTKSCTVCGATSVEQENGSAKHTFVDGVCTVCGVPDTVTTGGWINETVYWAMLPSNHLYIGGTGVISNNTNFKTAAKTAVSVEISEGITALDSYAFSGFSSLTSVVLPQGVTALGDRVFYNCSKLKNVYIPDTVTTIGGSGSYSESPFYQCSSALNIYCGANKAPSGWATYWNCGFNGYQSTVHYGFSQQEFSYWSTLNTSVSGITIPGFITKVPDYAFSNCDTLKYVELGAGIASIGQRAFYDCGGLRYVYIPASVKTIKSDSFLNCSSKLNIFCEGEKAASGWSSGWNKYSTGYSTPALSTAFGISKTEFDYWRTLTNTSTIAIPEGITTVPSYAFDNFYSLSSITLPSTLKKISSNAFNNCSKISSLHIPASVTTIEASSYSYSPFYGCSSSLALYCAASSSSSWGKYWNYYSSSSSLKTIYHVPAVDYEFWKSINTSAATIVIAEGVTTIPSDIFKNSTTLTSITIPSSVTTIGANAFYGCTSLEEIELGNGVTSIGDYAFFGCTGLTSVTIPDSVTTIGKYAFTACSALEEITIPESVTSIGNSAFNNDTALKKVHISDVAAWSVIDFNNDAANPLYYAKSLYLNDEKITALVIPEGITYIEDYAFTNGDFTSVTFPKSLQDVGYQAFNNCSNIEAVHISDLETWCGIAFENSYANPIYYGSLYANNTKITELVIPETVSQIKSYSFCNKNLTAVTIHPGVTSIGSSAFYNCTGLKEVHISDLAAWCGIDFGSSYSYSYANPAYYAKALTLNGEKLTTLTIPESVTYIADYAFAYCAELTAVTIPKNVESIQSYAFAGCTALSDVTMSGVTAIGNYAFDSCSALKDITLPNTVGTIGDYAFYRCSSLGKVVFPASVKFINYNAFRGCIALEQIRFLGDAPQINSSAFYNVTADTYYPHDGSGWRDDTLTNYGGTLTWHCSSDEKTAAEGSCGSDVRWMLDTAGTLIIYGSGAMNDYSISSSKTTAPWASYVKSIKKVVIDEGVTHIGKYAFYGCSNLRQIIFQGDMPTFHSYAFSSVSAMAQYKANRQTWIPSELSGYGGSIVWKPIGMSAEYLGYSRLDYDYSYWRLDTQGTLVLQNWESDYNYNNRPDWYTYRYHIKKVVVIDGEIGTYAFADLPMLTTFELAPDAYVKIIGDYAFEYCTKLKKVDLGVCDLQQLYSIGKYAFYGCSALESIFLPPDNSNWKIGDQAFAQCTALTEASIPGCVTLGAKVFYGCSKLKTIYINEQQSANFFSAASDSFSTVDATVYYPRDSWEYGSPGNSYGGTLTWVESDVGTCGPNAKWRYDPQTCTLTIYGSGAVCGSYFAGGDYPWGAFNDEIKSIHVAEGITYLPAHAFEHCSAATSITLPKSLTALELNAFNDCASLNNLILPSSLEIIGPYNGSVNFIRCTSLSDVYYFGTQEEWAEVENSSDVESFDSNMTIHFLELVPCSATCTQAGVEAHYRYDDTSVYNTMYDLNRNVITTLDTVPALGHTWKPNAAVAPTCTETGLTEGTYCAVCDQVLVAQEVVAAKGHTAVIDKAVAPTCTATGLTEGKHCSVCDEVLIAQEVVAVKGHTEVVDTAVAPTCTATGLTEGKRCSVCDEVLVAQEVVGAKGHSYGEFVPIEDAPESGHRKECISCGDLVTGTHEYGDDKICTVCSFAFPEARWGLASGENSDQAPTMWAGSGKLTDAVAYANTLSSGTAYIQLLSDVSTSAAIVFDKTAILDLNGHTIDRGLTEATANGNVITVNGNLTLCDTSEAGDGKITGGYSYNSGGGVNVAVTGTFTMNSGSISENTSTIYGGGVHCSGLFVMDGGSIRANASSGTSFGGGGVSCTTYSGTLWMKRGCILGNTTNGNGGGVYISAGILRMSSGTIFGNNSSNHGGGVYAEYCTVDLSGTAYISENVANGTLNESIGLYEAGTNGLRSNLYLHNQNTITVGTLTYGADIGITLPNGSGTFTDGGAEYVNSGYFTSDNAAYMVAKDGLNLKLTEILTISFNANGGSGTMVNQRVGSGIPTALNANTFTRTDYSFVGWNTKADGTGSTYVDRCSVTVAKAVTLYAQWKLNEARWGLADGENSDQAPTMWAGSGKLTDAVAYANTLTSGTAYIQLLSDVSTSAAIVFDKTAILDLNGCDIDRGLTKETANGNVITVNGNLILLDSSESASGKITGGYNSTSAGGVHVAAGGNFVMNSGSITGNTSANHGGGVWCQGNFTMNGGTISANVADNGKGDTGAGGGVSCSGTFTMNNGVISGNRSLYHGGGVYVNTSCVFTMNGGEISNNTGRYCGGVYVYGTATIAGGKITGNTSSDYGGGVFVPSGTLTISRNPEISGNVSASVAQNVYVYKRNPVIIDMLSAGAKIGVTLDSNAGIFTSGGAEYANSGYFFSDDAAYDVVTDGANLKLAAPITGSVSITGATEYGKTLSATYSNEAETVAYQWYRNGVAITDAIENVYTLGRDDVGKSVSVVVTGVGNYTGSKEATIVGTVSKATPNLGIVAASGVVKDTMTPADVVLTSESGPEGTLVITDAAMLANQSEYHWTFTPTESNCYNAVSGTVQIDVLDTVPPTVSIKVTDTDTEWKQLLNDISFGLFFKNTQQVTITYADDETGSGLKETLYYRSNEAIADFTDVQWSTYEGAFNIDPDGEFVIYAKATDNDGNSIIVNSDGIVLDATAPILQGITDGETYYGDTAFVVEESYLETLKVDGIDVTAQISENGEYTIVADNAQHTIIVADKAGNETTYSISVMKNYTVTVVVFNEETTQTVGHGLDVVLPTLEEVDGYNQVDPYWDSDGTNITEDTVITAIYTINKYTVTFKVEDFVVDTVVVEHDSLVTPPSTPTVEGYSFYGWFTEPECINEWNTETDVVIEDLVLYAVGGLWCESIPDYSYTGTALKPGINVYFGMIPLVLNKDYTISYKNNTNVYAPVDTAGELAEFEAKLAELNDPKAKTVTMDDGTVVTIAKVPQIVIKGKGNFAGTVTKYFVIEPINLNDDLVSVSDMTALYSGKVQNPKVTVSYGTKKLGTKDFTISYPDTDTTNGIPYFAAGTWTIQLDGTGNYTGTRYVDFVITKAQLMSKATIGKIAAYEYTGEEIKPAVTVSMNKVTLVENTDYTVDYLNNVDVGTATVVITGMGNYAGTKTATFKINGLAISKVQVNDIPKSVMYTGEEIELEGYSLFDKATGKFLEEGTHYTVDYDKNVDKGTATILFTGINSYTGTLKKTFKIDAYDILKDVDECIGVESNIVVPFMKGGAKPDPEITFNGETLVAGVDYTLAYKNNTAVAVGDPGNTKAPTITITGKGNFSGKLTLNFSIEAKSISKTTLTVDDKPYAAKATGLPTVTLTDTDGKKLAAGKDYDKAISYTYTTDVTLGDGTKRNAGDTVDKKDIIPVNTVICVTVSGIGAYIGETTATYRVVPQSLAKATVKVANQQYTGKPIVPDKSDITVTVNKVNIDPENFEIVSCTNNVNKGSATLTIRGVGENYGGVKTVTFKIDAKTMFWYEVKSTLFGLFS